MSKSHKSVKFRIVKAHRVQMYEKALDMLIAGRVNPDYPAQRFSKLKEVR